MRTGIFDLPDSSDPQHIALTERADLMLVRRRRVTRSPRWPRGLTDDLVSLMVCAAACPVVFAPAMNHRMWENPIAQENVAKLTELGYRFIGPEPGWLACRNVGIGRMTEPDTIFSELVAILAGTSSHSTPVAPKPSDHG